MNFETKTVNFVNETSLGKFIPTEILTGKDILNEKTDWKDFYKMAKDTSGKTLKNFEEKTGSLMDRPHVADAIKKSKDFDSFMKHIKKFEN